VGISRDGRGTIKSAGSISTVGTHQAVLIVQKTINEDKFTRNFQVTIIYSGETT
jgi:hypothetical protein